MIGWSWFGCNSIEWERSSNKRMRVGEGIHTLENCYQSSRIGIDLHPDGSLCVWSDQQEVYGEFYQKITKAGKLLLHRLNSYRAVLGDFREGAMFGYVT